MTDQNTNTVSYVDVCGTYAAFLSASEIGLGSILHTFQIPFAGHFLSLNQIFLLSRASFQVGKQGSIFLPGSISFIAAALKSLSPSGKKLTPMLAIGMQGVLFNTGIALIGHNVVGRIFGACIASLWGFLQPLLIYYFIFGHALFRTLVKIEESFRSWVPMDVPSVWYLCTLAVSVKALLAVAIALYASKLSPSAMLVYAQKLQSARLMKAKSIRVENQEKNRSVKHVVFLAAKDLCVWPFLACVLLSSISFIWAEGSSFSWIVWTVLRPCAIGFLFFFAVRIVPLEKVGDYLEKRSCSSLGKVFKVALEKIQQY